MTWLKPCTLVGYKGIATVGRSLRTVLDARCFRWICRCRGTWAVMVRVQQFEGFGASWFKQLLQVSTGLWASRGRGGDYLSPTDLVKAGPAVAWPKALPLFPSTFLSDFGGRAERVVPRILRYHATLEGRTGNSACY